jgi:hypothetical protein
MAENFSNAWKVAQQAFEFRHPLRKFSDLAEDVQEEWMTITQAVLDLLKKDGRIAEVKK